MEILRPPIHLKPAQIRSHPLRTALNLEITFRLLEYYQEIILKLLLEYLEKRMALPLFANARTVTNAIDVARMRHANRMFNSGDRVLTKSDLVTIEAEDMSQSSLFSEVA